MKLNLYFLDKSVTFTNEAGPREHYDSIVAADDSITRAKVLKILESCNRLAILSADPQAAFGAFAREFKAVEAAGGVVANPRGEVLMILRRGRWDLPKGHVEPGEATDACARRETAEETGIAATEVTGEICATHHAYRMNGAWELKRTVWYAMVSDGEEAPQPQHEEGIERVEWIPRTDLGSKLAASYPTIREVMEGYGKMKQ